MNDETLIRELQRISVLDNLRCIGCGYEHSCSIRGCDILHQAAQRLETLLVQEPNVQLTVKDLEKMDGEPVLVDFEDFADLNGHPVSCWAFVYVWSWPKLNSDVILTFATGFSDLADIMLRMGAKVYRRKPEANHV